MHSFDKRRWHVAATAVAVWLSLCGVAFAQTARARFVAAELRDEKLRVLLTNFKEKTPAADLATQVSQVVTSFESIVRRFPTSGYADDALWHAASLAETAYQRLSRGEDRDRALKMYRWLVQEYPRSPFAKQANAKIASMTKVAGVAPGAPPPPLPSSPALATASSTVTGIPAVNPAPLPDRATLKGIQRTVLPDVIRITLELD